MFKNLFILLFNYTLLHIFCREKFKYFSRESRRSSAPPRTSRTSVSPAPRPSSALRYIDPALDHPQPYTILGPQVHRSSPRPSSVLRYIDPALDHPLSSGTVKPLIKNTSKEFIKCRILHFLIMECCRYLVC